MRYFIVVFLLIGTVSAQNEIDALRFSQTYSTGTARSLGLGGAMTAVGADFSASSLNPAGLALYRKGEVVLSPSFKIASTKSSLLGQEGTDSRTHFGFQNLGLVFASDKSNFGFAIGFNQLAHFNRRISATAYNPVNSLCDDLTDKFNKDTLDYFGKLGYDTYLVAWDGERFVPSFDNGQVQQNYQVEERGAINEWSIGAGFNLDDKLYIGASIGVPLLYYKADLNYSESDIYGKNNHQYGAVGQEYGISDFTLRDSYESDGTGVNFRVGLIFQPADFFRFGISACTPTYYGMTNNYQTEISMNWDNNNLGFISKDAQTDPGVYNYSLTTPYKMNAGVMFMDKKLGFVSADFEMTDYSTARFGGGNNQFGGAVGNPFQDENQNITRLYSFAYSYRIGAEFRATEQFYLRAGYAGSSNPLASTAREYTELQVSSPLENADITNTNKQLKSQTATNYSISFGLGYRTQSYYFDFAYVWGQNNDKFTTYSLGNNLRSNTPSDPNNLRNISPVILNTRSMSNLVFSLGFKF